MLLALKTFNNYYPINVHAHETGAAGKSGDSAILKESWLLEQIAKNPEAWLGKDGVIAADGGYYVFSISSPRNKP